MLKLLVNMGAKKAPWRGRFLYRNGSLVVQHVMVLGPALRFQAAASREGVAHVPNLPETEPCARRTRRTTRAGSSGFAGHQCGEFASTGELL